MSRILLVDDRTIFVIGIEDIILDRVAAYEFWDKRRHDSEAVTQAITLLITHHDRIDRAYLEKSACKKGLTAALSDLQAYADLVRKGIAGKA